MATSRSASAAARLSRAAAAALRASSTGNQSIRSDLAGSIARPHALIAANENKIWNPNSFSMAYLNRIASGPALARSYSTSAATTQIPGAKGISSQKEKSTLGAMVVNLPTRTLFHIYEGVEEIMADYVHQEMTRNWILICFRLFLIIIMKDVFLALTHL